MDFPTEKPVNLGRDMSPKNSLEITPQAQSASKYKHQDYPRHMHHKDGSFVVVHSEAGEKALSEDYARRPWPKQEAAAVDQTVQTPTPPSNEPAKPAKPLEKMNKAELLAVAAEKGLTIEPTATNAAIVAAIKEATSVATPAVQ
jgi:hypothetical protein